MCTGCTWPSSGLQGGVAFPPAYIRLLSQNPLLFLLHRVASGGGTKRDWGTSLRPCSADLWPGGGGGGLGRSPALVLEAAVTSVAGS